MMGREFKMSVWTSMLSAILILVSAPANTSAEESSFTVHIHEATELEYHRKADNPDFISFSGDVTVPGLLLAYWEILYIDEQSLSDSEPLRQLKFRFYPAPNNSHLLPSFSFGVEAGNSPVNRVFLYQHRQPDKILDEFVTGFDEHGQMAKGLLAVFDDDLDEFLVADGGAMIQPVTMTLSGLASFIEGGHLFTYARTERVKSISAADYLWALIPDTHPGTYMARPWLTYLMAPENLTLYEKPNGAAVTEIPAGTHSLIKNGAERDGWVPVLLQRDEPDGDLTGYLRSDKVFPVN